MSRNYSVVEPHPHPTTNYMPTGRGGAGNIVKSEKVSHGSNATGPPSKVSLNARRPSNSFMAGRGGAGNVHPASERAIFSFDEELARQLKYEKDIAPVFHTGRGGAGNTVFADGAAHRGSNARRDSEAGSVRSNTSAESGAEAMNRKVRRSLEKFMNKAS